RPQGGPDEGRSGNGRLPEGGGAEEPQDRGKGGIDGWESRPASWSTPDDRPLNGVRPNGSATGATCTCHFRKTNCGRRAPAADCRQSPCRQSFYTIILYPFTAVICYNNGKDSLRWSDCCCSGKRAMKDAPNFPACRSMNSSRKIIWCGKSKMP